jgi:hypothetical protein
LLSIPLPPCRRYHPAGVGPPHQPACDDPYCLRPFSEGSASGDLYVTRPPMRSLPLRPGDSLTIPRMALSMGFRPSVSLQSAIQATGLLTLTLAGLTPAENASLLWTHTELDKIGRFQNLINSLRYTNQFYWLRQRTYSALLYVTKRVLLMVSATYIIKISYTICVVLVS